MSCPLLAFQRMRRYAGVFLAAFLLAAGPVYAQTSPHREIAGQLANGTPYNIYVPAEWSGVLVMDADLPNNNNATYRWMHEQGYATAGKSRNVTDWKVAEGSDDLIELKQIFNDQIGAPSTTIVWGRSLGGLVTRDAIEAYPEHFDGAIPMCGGGAGMIGMWNNRLDAVFALKTLIAPDDETFELVNISNEPAAIAALRAAVDLALATPEGRARLALAAAIAQIDGWPTGAPEPPASDDTETALQAIAAAYRAMLFSRLAVERVAGGNISWNAGVSYRQLFNKASATHRKLVLDLYAAARRDYRADLKALDVAPRIDADPLAVEWAIDNGSHTGYFGMPVLSVFTAVDPRAALSELQAYKRTVKAAGTQQLVRQAVAHVSGHCAFRDSEQAAAIDAMLERLQKRRWGPIGTAQDLNARAASLIEKSNGTLATPSRFEELPDVATFPRPFTPGVDRYDVAHPTGPQMGSL